MTKSRKIASSFLLKMKLALFIIISSFLIISKAQLTYIHQDCYDNYGRYGLLSNYRANLERAITELTTTATTTYFSNYTTGIGQDRVNALYSCRYDVSPQVCQNCFASTTRNISWCFSSVEGLIAYEECTLHYSNRSISGLMEDLPRLYHYSTGVEETTRFTLVLENTVTDLITTAASEFLISSRYFATATVRYSGSETIYALAQCNPDITSFECRTCLRTGFDGFTSNFTGANYGQIFMTSCRLSYILSSEVPSRPWRFAQTFLQLNQPRFTPRYFSSIGTRRSSIVGAIIATIMSVALSLKLLQ
ncbi:putative cysteine-rich repeat secretory protein 5 [Spinacia oleracea]|uniref:Cysteine-rich repeat secretory protein 5 n=1 Tax=Spinacia oleracea TaxID=3562 RepID=A0A9R0HST1_SPIOL|nr:putative cysteine-rich repeat secretory protein 5 [Spinacia oleracea]